MKKTTKEYIEILDKCKNKENIGNGCWEFCPYRENGCCELNKNEIISTLLSDITGKDFVYDANFIWTLKNLIKESNNKEKEELGEWKYSPVENIAICSICGNEHYLGTYHQFATNYCPNCGTKMKK